ncbi:NAD(P)/FAD-dependent oxidoreductase [Sphingomonas sp. PB1R3]|uniref:NAD(P)/FAD-dependent oxidoreductase n=1 Tax=Sphingomonas flavida TaxID=3096154 RepID=UPI002FC97AF0
MSEPIVDVAIIGAGAAGAAAACTLAPYASVTLIDRVATPVWRIGETLPGAARRVLTAIGAFERFAAAGHGIAPLKVSRWGSDDPVELDAMCDPDGMGWRIDRARFEADLRADAAARGAAFVFACVGDIRRLKDGWHVTLDDGMSVFARRLIDASGRRTSLMRKHGQRRMVMDRLACAYQRVPQPQDSDTTTYTQACAEGWWYTAMLPDEDRIVAFHGDAGGAAMRDVLPTGPLMAARSLPGLKDAIGTVDPSRATPSMLCAANSVARSAAGEGWLAAGDSAIALDPLSSQGLFNALSTGLEAGEATLTLLNGDTRATERYATRMSRIWQAYCHHHALYYGMERRWRDAPFWARRIGSA